MLLVYGVNTASMKFFCLRRALCEVVCIPCEQGLGGGGSGTCGPSDLHQWHCAVICSLTFCSLTGAGNKALDRLPHQERPQQPRPRDKAPDPGPRSAAAADARGRAGMTVGPGVTGLTRPSSTPHNGVFTLASIFLAGVRNCIF